MSLSPHVSDLDHPVYLSWGALRPPFVSFVPLRTAGRCLSRASPCTLHEGGGGAPCAVHHRVPSGVTATDKHLVNTCQRSDSAVRLLCRSAQLWEAQGPDPE